MILNQKLGDNEEYVIKKFSDAIKVKEISFVDKNLTDYFKTTYYDILGGNDIFIASIDNILFIDNYIFYYVVIKNIVTSVLYVGCYDPADEDLINKIKMNSTL